jgi:hypothetical protein
MNGVRTDDLLSERHKTASADKLITNLYAVLLGNVLIKR